MQDVPWPEICLTAFNTDPDSDNKIHSDDTAGKYGFEGGLVPGVSVYAYTTQPLSARLGGDWLRGTSVRTKFIHPVYDGDAVTVRTRSEGDGAHIELLDSKGALCAITESTPLNGVVESNPYEFTPTPDHDRRLSPRTDAFPPGHMLGSWSFEFEHESHEAFCASMLDDQEAYRGDQASWHPAWCVANANWMLMANVALGPWIHTGSTIHYIDAPVFGDVLTIHGKVAKAYERREHDMVDLDLVVVDPRGKVLARIVHSAIIRLAQDKA